MKGLALSKNNRPLFSLPKNAVSVSPIQRILNQRTNRYLSRATVKPSTTPIWQQPTFTPSEDLQRRFTPEETEASLLKAHETPVSPQPTPAVTPVTAPAEKSAPTTMTPEGSTVPTQKVASVQPNTPSVEAKITPPPSTQAPPQTNSAPSPSPATAPSSENEPTVQLSDSLDAVTHIRQQIESQELKLQQLQRQSPDVTKQEQEVATEQKTKDALIKNLEHAIQNTQSELQELENKSGTNATILESLKKQFKQQKDLFGRLLQEKKLLMKKQEAIQEKVVEQQKTQQQLSHLEQQHDQLVQNNPSPAPPVSVQNSTTPANIATAPAAAAPSPQKVIMPAITKQPNAINGIVQNAAGKLLSNAVVIIKSNDQRPLRALKTNELGQFWITTALDNGEYLVQTEKDDLTFDTMKIHLDGSVVPPVLIQERAT
jgi:hypothetical protein